MHYLLAGKNPVIPGKFLSESDWVTFDGNFSGMARLACLSESSELLKTPIALMPLALPSMEVRIDVDGCCALYCRHSGSWSRPNDIKRMNQISL